MLAPDVEAEIAALATQHGAPQRVVAAQERADFNPLNMDDRYGEICMVIRRPNQRLITAIKTFYPAGAYRLLTGGVDHGETIAHALQREVAEETGLDVIIRRFLAVIEYPWLSIPLKPPSAGEAKDYPFATFAFLLDEIGGTLTVQDVHERIASFREITIEELPTLAAVLEQVPDQIDPEIGGSWRDWGHFRAVSHRVVYALLS